MLKSDIDNTSSLLVEQVKRKIGKELLLDSDVLILAFEEILKTYTHDEKNYNK